MKKRQKGQLYMNTIIYLILVAVCIVFVYNVLEKLKRDKGMQFCESRPVELICIVLLGFLLAGVVSFLLKFILVPLVLLVVIYYLVNGFRR